MEELATRLDLINVELVDTLIIRCGKNKGVEKLKIYKSTRFLRPQDFFLGNRKKVLEPKKIALFCKEYPEIIGEDTPLFLLAETSFGELAILEIVCCCNKLNFNALSFKSLEFPPKSRIAVVC